MWALALALIPEAFDRPATRLINGFANHSWLFDYLIDASSKYATFTGVVMMALIWYCWFEKRDPERRVRVLVGTLASIGAGAISRILQHELPTHPRPYYDTALGFQLPLNLDEVFFNNWNSFPSDHVAVFAGFGGRSVYRPAKLRHLRDLMGHSCGMLSHLYRCSLSI
jgi:undecaprenyl-diphosphatase